MHLMFWIYKARERDAVSLEIVLRRFKAVIDNGKDLDARLGELPVLLRQPTEVSATEGSHEAT